VIFSCSSAPNRGCQYAAGDEPVGQEVAEHSCYFNQRRTDQYGNIGWAPYLKSEGRPGRVAWKNRGCGWRLDDRGGGGLPRAVRRAKAEREDGGRRG
jgi:hypothetical protein